MISPISPAVIEAILPRKFVRTVDWAGENVVLPRGSEITGKFRIDLFPHMAEPLDCCDDPFYRRVTLQIAARMGKTVAGQVFLAKTGATNPHPMALADADKHSTERVIERTWDLFSLIDALGEKMPPPRLRGSDRIQLADFLIHGAWSGSPATAADYAAFVVVLNEIDKMTRAASKEADFAHLMAERAKGYPDSTILDLSTPSMKGSSRVEALRLAGDNRGRYVPCPYCNHFQMLRIGDTKSRGGLRWEHDSEGNSQPHIAFETAWYECEKCSKRIEDHHRYSMLNSGMWVPEGCRIEKGKLAGTKARPGPHASFGPLSILHSLLPSITWGLIGQEYVNSVHAARKGTKDGVERMRNFINSWMAETWEPRPRKTRPHEVSERLKTDVSIGLCPDWSVFLTGAADVHGDGNELVWQVCAWGPHARGHLVDYGYCHSWEDFEKLVRGAEYPHADGGTPLKISRMAIDSGDGHHTETVYQFCRRVSGCVPIKGQTGKFPEFVQVSEVNAVPGRTPPRHVPLLGNTSTRFLLYKVNHERSQRWIQSIVDGEVTPELPHFWSLCFEASLDGGLIDQLVAEFPHEEMNEDGYVVHKWTRTGANEQRDLARYNRSIADLLMGNGKNWDKISRSTTLADRNRSSGWFSQRRSRR